MIAIKFSENIFQVLLKFPYLNEEYLHDRTKITENRLEHDRNIFTLTNLNIGIWPKNLQQRIFWYEGSG